MEELTKNRKRAVRRKRNLIAKELRTNKLYAPKVVEPKRKRYKINVRDIDEYDLDIDGHDLRVKNAWNDWEQEQRELAETEVDRIKTQLEKEKEA